MYPVPSDIQPTYAPTAGTKYIYIYMYVFITYIIYIIYACIYNICKIYMYILILIYFFLGPTTAPHTLGQLDGAVTQQQVKFNDLRTKSASNTTFLSSIAMTVVGMLMFFNWRNTE